MSLDTSIAWFLKTGSLFIGLWASITSPTQHIAWTRGTTLWSMIPTFVENCSVDSARGSLASTAFQVWLRPSSTRASAAWFAPVQSSRNRHESQTKTGALVQQGLVNVPMKHHPTIGDMISNRYLFWWWETNPQKGTSIPSPVLLGVRGIRGVLWLWESNGRSLGLQGPSFRSVFHCISKYYMRPAAPGDGAMVTESFLCFSMAKPMGNGYENWNGNGY